ncbi:hypothetical protein SARI_01789 [Salmonella enterica subsp. arizonae serovar 62:z4,z23:-]|uniref:Uncharacterized protein n=1 Tax=Salmonella arizonae (strain ATCC BAA-731 / CDC346-86 / RSK2980) TaxID=41514 RepID=A9MGB3_SALAR|nr:hypothetical protein SARI_01789 [Salmonella enterica subsp. arizonae serovar 62:z4,z23:-]
MFDGYHVSMPDSLKSITFWQNEFLNISKSSFTAHFVAVNFTRFAY